LYGLLNIFTASLVLLFESLPTSFTAYPFQERASFQSGDVRYPSYQIARGSEMKELLTFPALGILTLSAARAQTSSCESGFSEKTNTYHLDT
jgi:hypothetical protein